jgi:hypothetical protein
VQISVAGGPYDMGLQHGEQLRDEIRELLDAVHHHVLYGQPGWFGWGVRRALRTVTRIMAAQLPLRYRREMAGIARAADVSYRDVLLLNCFDDVCANLNPIGAIFGRLACSAFAVTGARTVSNQLLCGRNLDYFVPSAAGDDVWAATNYMKDHVAVVAYQPEDRTAWASVGWPGYIGGATAMNARGITVSALTVATLRNSPLGVPAGFLYRRIVEETDSLADAIRVFQRSRRPQGNNVLLGSAQENTAAVVEYTAFHLAVRRPEDGWIATANHFTHPEMRGRGARLAFLSSTERLARLEDLCGCPEDSPFDESLASAREYWYQQLRPDEGAGAWPGDEPRAAELARFGAFLLDTATRRPDSNEYCTVWNPCTIYSTLFEPTQGRIWVRPSDRPDRRFQPVCISE